MKKLRLLLGTLFVLCVLSIVPASSAQAATVGNLNPLNHWISTSSGYSVMLKTNHRLYYKYNGKTVGISQNVYVAAVNGTQLAYLKKTSGYANSVVLYDLKTKKSKSYRTDSLFDGMDPVSVTLYNGYIYYSYFDGDCGSYHEGCLKASTMKAASNTCYKRLVSTYSSDQYAYAYYQNGQYLIVIEGKGPDCEGGHLRIFNMKTGSYTKTVSSKCCLFAVVGSTLYYVDVTPATSNSSPYDKFTIHSCTLTGGSNKTLLTLKESASYEDYSFAFHGGKVIVRDCNQKTFSDRYRDYTFSTGKYTSSTEANFNYMYAAYFHCDEHYESFY